MSARATPGASSAGMSSSATPDCKDENASVLASSGAKQSGRIKRRRFCR